MDGHDDPTTDSHLAWTLAIGFLHEACRYMGNHNLVPSFGKWTHPYIFAEGVKSAKGPKCRLCKSIACFFFFPFTTQFLAQDVSGYDQTHFGAAQTHLGSCYASFRPVMCQASRHHSCLPRLKQAPSFRTSLFFSFW
jgi:hypothetical protein